MKFKNLILAALFFPFSAFADPTLVCQVSDFLNFSLDKDSHGFAELFVNQHGYGLAHGPATEWASRLGLLPYENNSAQWVTDLEIQQYVESGKPISKVTFHFTNSTQTTERVDGLNISTQARRASKNRFNDFSSILVTVSVGDKEAMSILANAESCK